MGLLLEILEGELKGLRIAARDGLTIGRSKGMLTIRDSKLSAQHAAIQARPDGHLWLVDAGSANGIKVGTNRLRELELKDGVSFILGRTSFRIVESDEVSPGGAASEEEVARAVGAFAPPKRWQDVLTVLSVHAEKEAKPTHREITPFSTPFHLRFTRGIQSGTDWTIGYGPRQVGASSLDLRLEDQSLPKKCFQLLPKDGGILLRNEADNDVKLNGKRVDSEFLKNGDVIEIKSTKIEVEIDDGD